ncbi:hypothetical protein BST97_06485 [Nonlabens spongiae]|uniref:DUF922 domain-containing protein n=1 Tax=Nonlabens spongiae TaxID=331648 RepID=A0A1W6MJ87_9FLAO|nr:DUF922 domain-containing protein [Nonlabens spongiae]ARN77671.1 hypothetical protein BST97_06485 [Nonlabens spongiae]
MRVISVLIVALLINTAEPSISWTYEEHPVLSWEDFRGEPAGALDRAAAVNSGMSYAIQTRTSEGRVVDFSVEVESAFYPELSWKRDLRENSRSLLKHEQLHWDITHLHVLKLRAAFRRYRPVKNINKEIDFIFRKFEKDREAMQSRYDLETGHGLKKEEQQRWEIYIAEELLKVEM